VLITLLGGGDGTDAVKIATYTTRGRQIMKRPDKYGLVNTACARTPALSHSHFSALAQPPLHTLTLRRVEEEVVYGDTVDSALNNALPRPLT